MAQHEAHCTSRSGDVLETIAFGSMLVFASVMPPLGPDGGEPNSRRDARDIAAADGGDPADAAPTGMGASRSRQRFDS